MQLTAQAIAELVRGEVEGDPNVLINRPSTIEDGGAGSISFLGNPKYEKYAYTTTASVLLVRRDFQPRHSLQATLIRVDDVYAAVALLLQYFGRATEWEPGIAEEAYLHESVELGHSPAIGRWTIVEAGSRIGDHCRIAPQVYIGQNVRIGNEVTLFPGVRILDDCRIGNRVTIHPNAVIGSDGFGFAPQPDGSFRKIAQIGNVIVEDDVEIGANTTVDRASIGSTIIHQGVKLDNLIQVGHNVEVGEHTVMAAQSGIAGSTKLGARCQVGGQVGFVGHLRIADGSRFQAKTGVASNIDTPDGAYFGYTAIPYNNYVRSYSVFKKLPELYRAIARLERELEELKARSRPAE
jgi:UDP-3-O-[3-hydroxymyristoyl] glucosamine N-acyltransferase